MPSRPLLRQPGTRRFAPVTPVETMLASQRFGRYVDARLLRALEPFGSRLAPHEVAWIRAAAYAELGLDPELRGLIAKLARLWERG
jgi:hypothetical protein